MFNEARAQNLSNIMCCSEASLNQGTRLLIPGRFAHRMELRSVTLGLSLPVYLLYSQESGSGLGEM